MRQATLQFLHSEREELRSDIGFFEAGRREIVEIVSTGRTNITRGVLARLMERLDRFEELIAAYEAKLD